MKITLAIFDRKLDIVSPLIHNFYYYPMLADIFLIDINNPIVKIKEK